MAFSEVIPSLYYEDAEAALDWLERVLEFRPSMRWRLRGPSTTEAAGGFVAGRRSDGGALSGDRVRVNGRRQEETSAA